MTTPVFVRLHADAIALLKKHHLDKFVSPYSVDLVNLLMRKNIDKVKAAVDYSTTINLINEAVATMVKGMKLDIVAMMPVQADKDALYKLFEEWRSTLLWQIAMEEGMAAMALVPATAEPDRQA